MATEHIEIVNDLVVSPGQRWSPTLGSEALRLTSHSLQDAEARTRVESQAIEVLSRCHPPHVRGESPRTGLVVGHVQSGKTLSFTTVAALAHDNGFPLVILLAGTTDILHSQTARRLASDLEVARTGGMAPWFLVANPRDGAGDVHTMGQYLKQSIEPGVPQQFRRSVVITVMKNRSRMDQLCRVLLSLDQFGVSIAEIPALIIDDEADQAGLNTLAADDDQSATYASIMRLRESIPNHTYVMYTATPQAPLLLNIADSLSPDFVAVLEPGAGYTGGVYFFEEHPTDFLRTIGPSEAAQALDPTATEPPTTLLRALATYFTGLAVRGTGPLSMLVHPSHTVDLHEKYAGWIRNLTTTWSEVLNTPGDDRLSLIEEHFRPAYEDVTAQIESAPTLDEVLNQMPWWITATRVRVINSSNPEDNAIPWNEAPSWILVGGNKLDRGFTVEGLTVTYMPRGVGVGNADTIQQRARFFGYKHSYRHLCRAWLTTPAQTAYERYVEHEKVLRKDLQRVAAEGISLKQWRRQMLLDPALKPCRRAVIDLPFLHGRVLGDSWSTLQRLVLPQTTADLNLSMIDAFIERQGTDSASDPRDTRKSDPNTVVTVPLAELIRAVLADWRTHGDDRPTLNQLVLLLSARLDDAPDLLTDVYLMRGLRGRDREIQPDGARVTNLFEGRRPAGAFGDDYPGDAKFFTEGRVSLQVHSVNVTRKGSDAPVVESVPGLALWIPRDLAGGVLLQVESA